MTYCTHFYAECPDTAMEFEIEIIFFCEEEDDKEMFWGYPVNVPASGAVEVLEVFKDGKEWLNYSDSITDQLYDNEWTRCAEMPRCSKRNTISKPIKQLPCRRQLAA